MSTILVLDGNHGGPAERAVTLYKTSSFTYGCVLFCRYFPQSKPVDFVLGGIGDNLVTFILFWTLAYALVYIY